MNAPIPSAEAVETLAATWHERMRQEYPEAEQPPAWDDLEELQRCTMKMTLLPLLLAVYPQIVSDVLTEHAYDLAAADDLTRAESPSWLLARAAEVHP